MGIRITEVLAVSILLFASVTQMNNAIGEEVQTASNDSPLVVMKVPEKLRVQFSLDRFYQKCIVVGGLIVVGSDNVSDSALSEAAFVVTSMLKSRTDILGQLAANRVRLAVMATTERTCDIPEHSDLTPQDHWNRSARGLGATHARPCVSCAEENVLNLNGDPYDAECILIHEFSHAIHQMALVEIDASFQAKLERCYQAAMRNQLWKDTYAASNVNEYWAEGVQSWFDCNRQNDGLHNHVDTREKLQTYDPGLYALIASVFVDKSYRYLRSDSPIRTEPHLLNLNRETLPTFRWDNNSE